jgi:hypothetical protein
MITIRKGGNAYNVETITKKELDKLKKSDINLYTLIKTKKDELLK